MYFSQGQEGDLLSIESDGIDTLRAKIMEVLRQEPYMGEKVPTRWAMFSWQLCAMNFSQI